MQITEDFDCGRCGQEAFVKLIGDEWYDWCADCGCIEGLRDS